MISPAARSKHMIPRNLLSTLRADLDSRRIEHGMSRLANCSHVLESFNPSLQNAAEFLCLLAEWCDLGYGDLSIVKRLLANYDNTSRSRLPISEYMYVRMTEGMVAMKEELVDNAVDHFDTALKLAGEINAWDTLAIAHHWMARCQRKKGQYEIALKHIKMAREAQAAHGQVQNEVPARVLESLILFEKGEPMQVAANLRDAESLLKETDDYGTRGNIQHTFGRILRRQLRYGQAIKHYQHAIECFQKRDSYSVNVARALIEMSLTRLQIAGHLRNKIETCRGHNRTNGRPDPVRTKLVKELADLYELILSDLHRAEEIYQRQPNVRGIARLHMSRGYLYLDRGELDIAGEEAAEAYAAAESKRDFILMTASRNLQCRVENAKVEEEVERWSDHAVAAQDYAQDAVELANSTQDRRLLASAYTWYGLTLSNSFFNTPDRAREAMDRASAYLESGVFDFIWEDFQKLKSRLLQTARVEPKVQQWTKGEIGDRTFEQLQDDFADLVIPRIWEQEKGRYREPLVDCQFRREQSDTFWHELGSSICQPILKQRAQKH